MIDLQVKIKGELSSSEPFVLKLINESADKKDETDAIYRRDGSIYSVSSQFGVFEFELSVADEVNGDICIIYPIEKKLLRFIRENSTANTLLLTEQCDQACIMCSQPPRNKVYDYYDLYKQALCIAPQNIVIGISGGEPTLEKHHLFPFLSDILKRRPDLKFHILTNGQHFESADISFLNKTNDSILWGIPLYSHQSTRHDEIVGKSGAFNRLIDSFNMLFRAGAQVEIRTVVLKQNFHDLPAIASFITRHLSVCNSWAIMQLENIGFAKMNWEHIFVDSSQNFEPVSQAITISKVGKVDAKLFNFPLCTVPEDNRVFAYKSISDWKNKYLDICARCKIKDDCCGFFSWYNTEHGYKELKVS